MAKLEEKPEDKSDIELSKNTGVSELKITKEVIEEKPHDATDDHQNEAKGKEELGVV